MGLALAEQKEVREMEEGGSARERWEPWPARRRAAGRQAGGLAGGRGCAWLHGSQGQRYSGPLASEEATWQPPSLSLCLSPGASLSLHLAVFCSPPPAIPAVWS